MLLVKRCSNCSNELWAVPLILPHKNKALVPRYLTHAGFIDVQVLQEQADFVYANAQEWWDSRWTHGPRYALEQMSPEVLAQFKEEVFTRLVQEAQSHGIHETLRLQYILADKGI